ncbi:hypothetical protein Tco_0943086 [Tanacetum coccineum]
MVGVVLCAGGVVCGVVMVSGEGRDTDWVLVLYTMIGRVRETSGIFWYLWSYSCDLMGSVDVVVGGLSALLWLLELDGVLFPKGVGVRKGDTCLVFVSVREVLGWVSGGVFCELRVLRGYRVVLVVHDYNERGVGSMENFYRRGTSKPLVLSYIKAIERWSVELETEIESDDFFVD